MCTYWQIIFINWLAQSCTRRSAQTTNSAALRDRTPAVHGPTPACLREVGRVTAGLPADVLHPAVPQHSADHTFNFYPNVPLL